MSTDYMQAYLLRSTIPTCPACFMGAQKKPSREVELNVSSISAATEDGRLLVGYVAVCPTCRIVVPMQLVPRT